MNLFHVGKQYLTLCKVEAAVTRNLIGRKIISNVKHADARNSLPILDVIAQVTNATVCQSTANKRYVKRQVSVIRVYTCSERHLTFLRNIDTRRQWSVGNIGWNEWLYWEIVINDHCPGSVWLGKIIQLSSNLQVISDIWLQTTLGLKVNLYVIIGEFLTKLFQKITASPLSITERLIWIQWYPDFKCCHSSNI